MVSCGEVVAGSNPIEIAVDEVRPQLGMFASQRCLTDDGQTLEANVINLAKDIGDTAWVW
ncbi:hypothetical protein ASF70_12795 [Rhizobium sp. Leaf321]|nr:hypothetical protein ASF70_12795 [Rhizobium sp. Leaf321]